MLQESFHMSQSDNYLGVNLQGKNYIDLNTLKPYKVLRKTFDVFRLTHILFALSFIFLLISSQSKAASIKNITIENGLSNRRVLGSAYDGKGYLWFATKTNIDRYDGEKFDSYKLSINEKNRGIVSDNKQNIYTFTDQTAYCYDENIDDFKQIFSMQNRKDFFASASITGLFFNADNQMIVTTNLGALIYDKKNINPIKLLNNVSILNLVFTNQNEYIFATLNGILVLKKNANNELTPVSNPLFDSFKSIRVQSLYYDENNGKLWIGTFANGLYVCDMKFSRQPELIQKITLPIKVITNISNNEIWIGTDGEGILIYDRNTAKYKRTIAHSDAQDESIGANGIYNIMQAAGSVWISTYTAGIFVVNTKSIVDRQYRHQKNNQNSITDDHVNAVFEDRDGDLWFGTNKGVSVYYTQTKAWKHYLVNGDEQSNENSVILSIYEDLSGNIWIGGYGTKLAKINKKTGVLSNLNIVSGAKSYIYSILEDEMGNIWFGGAVDYLQKYNPQTNTITKYGIEGVNKIFNFDSNTLYLATYKGLYTINKNNGIIQTIKLNKVKGGEKITSYPFINNIVRDKYNGNALWIATEGSGLYHFDLAKNEINVLDTKSGLSSDYVYGLLYDNSLRLWISTEDGLDCYNQNTDNISSYSNFDGLSDNTFNFLAYAKLRNGKLLFGTPKGVNEITPHQINSKTNPDFNFHFKGFYLFYEKMKALTPGSPLKESIDKTRKIKLNYKQNTFSIDFINLEMPNQSGRTLYSWILDGYDDKWTQPSTEHKAVYTNVPAGNYKFMVKAINNDTKKESEVYTIQIRKKPPFWASIFAYIIYSIFLLWLTYILVKYWLNKINTRFTEEKMKFFMSIAHEIKTPITLIKAPLNEIDDERLSNEGRSALELARKNIEKLFHIVTQFLDFQKIEKNAMNLQVEETNLHEFVDNIVNNYIYLVKTKELSLTKVNECPENTTVWIDRNKVQIMLENLLSNAIKYTPKGGEVDINVAQKNNRLSFIIHDTGIGIPVRAQSNLFKTFYRAKNAVSSQESGTGIGLSFTKKLVDLHKGEILFTSKENEGSTFTINIPTSKADYDKDEIAEIKNDELNGLKSDIDTGEQYSMQILLVEDNEELRSYIAKILRKHYTVLEAANGVEALEMLEKESPDLILSDVLMAQMNGFDLCAAVKSNISTCHIPFILLTSLSEREDVVKGLNLGADDYITKPFDMTILESKINTIFNNRALFRKKYIDKSISLNEKNQMNDLNRTFMNKMVELVEANITNEDFNIDELAYEMAMSRSVFFKKIKSLTGQNPKDFIRDIKMNKAADLLREQKYSITEIAYLIGFPNAKYFSTAFKKYYGTSPTTFIDKEKREDNFTKNLSDPTN